MAGANQADETKAPSLYSAGMAFAQIRQPTGRRWPGRQEAVWMAGSGLL